MGIARDKVRKQSICILIIIAVFTLYLIHTEERSVQGISVKKMSVFSGAKFSDHGSHTRYFLYLVQTEECLPTQLREALGNSSACQCDVAVLSYRTICNDTSLAHVSYLFNSSTTWTTGRNVLFYMYIHGKSERYLYYVMMDDDIFLKWGKQWENQLKSDNPWRTFEDFLKRTQLAVVALETFEKNLKRMVKIHERKHCPISPEYNPVVLYDPAVNAFHYQAVEYMLPYWSGLDNMSWFYSQLHQMVLSEIVFPGQVVVHRYLLASNSKHRPYPRGKNGNAVLPMVIRNIRERVPRECQGSCNVTLQLWETQTAYLRLRNSSTYCLPPPAPNQTILPFRTCN